MCSTSATAVAEPLGSLNEIKKLELVGFKSFVDRTVLHFDHDVLGIVGPNGCGKSNIVDAIRWCMGEQSARHLRGRSMEDVIFNGSESRAPHDFAEVTLTFENDDPAEMPLEYKEYAEIAVTRRLYRTGESEYLINKTQVRLRDVTDLFLGTGRGHQGLLHRRAGQGRAHRQRQARGPPPAHRGGRRHHEVQEPEEAGREEDGAHAAEPAARRRHRGRDRAQPRVAQAPGGQGRALRRVPQRARGPAAPRGVAPVPGARRLDEARGRRGRAPRRRTASRSRGELAAREAELEVARLEVHAAEERLDAATRTRAFASRQRRSRRGGRHRARPATA